MRSQALSACGKILPNQAGTCTLIVWLYLQEQSLEGDGAMAPAILLFLAQLSVGQPQFREIEHGIIAEAPVAARFADDHSVALPFGRKQNRTSLRQRQRADKAGSAAALRLLQFPQ